MSESAHARPLAVVSSPPATPPRVPDLAAPLRVLRLFWGAGFAGCVMLPLSLLVAPLIGEWVALPLAVGGLILVPLGGLGVIIGAFSHRDAVHARALFSALLTLALCGLLAWPAARVGWEMAYGSRLGSLEPVAAQVDAAYAEADRHPDPPTTATEAVNDEFRARLRAQGVARVTRGREGLRFETDGPVARSLLYAGSSRDPSARACSHPRLGFLGGRWYTWECERWAR
jgi:hypothetical protein